MPSAMPDEFATAVLVSGLPTVTFRSRPFTRIVRTVFGDGVVQGAVTIYRGGTTNAARITKALVGNPNTYSTPFILPAGQALYVVFDNAATPVSAASAKLSAFREDS